MNSIFKGQAIKNLVGGYYHMEADGTIVYLSNQTPPTEKEINDEIAKLQSEYDAKQYQRDRLQEYPDLQECIHAILDDDLTALQAKRKLIKDKFPKP